MVTVKKKKEGKQSITMRMRKWKLYFIFFFVLFSVFRSSFFMSKKSWVNFSQVQLNPSKWQSRYSGKLFVCLSLTGFSRKIYCQSKILKTCSIFTIWFSIAIFLVLTWDVHTFFQCHIFLIVAKNHDCT